MGVICMRCDETGPSFDGINCRFSILSYDVASMIGLLGDA